ncbi:MAG: hypothetical protein KME43_15505 [Myxacorys chilensis ATA2-1-KO14]|nr:hypothetical protein [Myxacorys chilensis ATA2-1-KO14]
MGKRNDNSRALVSKATPRSLNRAIATTRFTCRLLLYLTQRHPILFWTGSWLVLVLISGISLKGILQIDVSPPQTEQAQSEVVVQAPAPVQYSAQESASSFGLLAAVVVCCGAASMLLARQLRPAKATPRFQGKLASRSLVQRNAAPASTALHPRPPAPSPLKTAPQSVRRSAPNAPRSSAQPRPAKPVAARSAAVAEPRQPKVKVVPQYEHPLDWTEPGLAEMMDIRKHDSISSFL